MISESTQAMIELETGNVDAVLSPSATDIESVIGGSVEGITYTSFMGDGLQALEFNFNKEFARDINVRKAIACAIDRQSIVDGVYNGLARVASQNCILHNESLYVDKTYNDRAIQNWHFQ